METTPRDRLVEAPVGACSWGRGPCAFRYAGAFIPLSASGTPVTTASPSSGAPTASSRLQNPAALQGRAPQAAQVPFLYEL